MVDVGTICRPNAPWDRVRGVEKYRIELFASSCQDQLERPFAQEALLDDRKFVVECGRGKALAPNPSPDILCESKRKCFVRQHSVSFDRSPERGQREPFARDTLERFGEARQCCLGHGQSCGVGVSAKARDCPRGALGDEIKCIAQMKAGDGASRAAQLAIVAAGKNDRGTVKAILEP